jgi:hypothetical protein
MQELNQKKNNRFFFFKEIIKQPANSRLFALKALQSVYFTSAFLTKNGKQLVLL